VMLQENVELMRRAAEAFNRGDYGGYTADFAPEFEYLASGVVPGSSGVYRGQDEFRRCTEGFWDGFETTTVEVHKFIEAGDRVVIFLTMRARGKQSEPEPSWSFFQVWTFRDGKVTRVQGFPERKDALEAAGLRD
jgi:ketosteroid isomerase-like protein